MTHVCVTELGHHRFSKRLVNCLGLSHYHIYSNGKIWDHVSKIWHSLRSMYITFRKHHMVTGHFGESGGNVIRLYFDAMMPCCYCDKRRITYVLEWKTVYAFMTGLFWQWPWNERISSSWRQYIHNFISYATLWIHNWSSKRWFSTSTLCLNRFCSGDDVQIDCARLMMTSQLIVQQTIWPATVKSGIVEYHSRWYSGPVV